MGRVMPGQLDLLDDHLPRTTGRQGPERPALLLVDDLPENLFALEQVLRRDDVDIVTARSGTEALEVLLARQVALAIVDVQMPEMDGFDLARYMRGVERTRLVPIIFVTAGSHDPGRVFQGYDAGAVDFLYKPIDVHILRGKVDAFIAMDRQRKALESSESRFRRLYDLGLIGIVFTGQDRRIVDANDAFLNLLGYTRDELQAGTLSARDLTPDGFALADERAIAQLRSTGRYEVFQKGLLHKDGHTVPVLMGGSIVDHEGVSVSFVLDMTEQHESERMRELFVGMLGHDLRNPLGSMMAGTQIALARSEDERVRKPLRRALAGGERMLRLIDQILDMTRLRNCGPVEIRRVETDLGPLVEEVLHGAPAPRERFRVEAMGDIRGFWDPDRLFQVLSNLVGNACEHGSENEPIVVEIDGRADDGVAMRIRNSGAPISEELRRVIFEPFRSSNDRGRPRKGLGLGLYISKTFILAHGGSIDLEQCDSGGTAFNVSLPRA